MQIQVLVESVKLTEGMGIAIKKFRIWEVCNISEIKREVDEYIESIGQYSTYTENEPNSSYGLTPKMPTLLKLNQSDTE